MIPLIGGRWSAGAIHREHCGTELTDRAVRGFGGVSNERRGSHAGPQTQAENIIKDEPTKINNEPAKSNDKQEDPPKAKISEDDFDQLIKSKLDPAKPKQNAEPGRVLNKDPFLEDSLFASDLKLAKARPQPAKAHHDDDDDFDFLG